MNKSGLILQSLFFHFISKNILKALMGDLSVPHNGVSIDHPPLMSLTRVKAQGIRNYKEM